MRSPAVRATGFVMSSAVRPPRSCSPAAGLEVRDIVDEKVGTEEPRGTLRLRRAELETAMAAAAARLVQVGARLRAIESEGHMPHRAPHRPDPWPPGSTPTATGRSDTPREVNLECPENRDDWVTELQAPVTRA